MTTTVPVSEKYLLTVKEASLYFGIGVNKLYRILRDAKNSGQDFIVLNGARFMIIRKKFEEYLNNAESI